VEVGVADGLGLAVAVGVAEGVAVGVGVGVTTSNVALGPAVGARFPAASLAVDAEMDIPRVPAPEIVSTVTVYGPEPETPTVPVADPVEFSVMSPAARVTVSAPV